MNRKLSSVLLIDDDEPTNFLHRIILEEHLLSEKIMVAETVKQALKLLENSAAENDPELIFLDLNMPGLNGWDFLEKYSETNPPGNGQPLIYILTTSINPDDRKKAGTMRQVTGFLNKPLTDEIVRGIVREYFG